MTLCKTAPSPLAAITLMYGVGAEYGVGEETHLFFLILLNLWTTGSSLCHGTTWPCWASAK